MKLFYRTVFIAYLLILVWLVVFKFSRELSWVFDYQKRSLNMIPFAGVSHRTFMEVFINFAAFIPFGLLFSINFKKAAFWRKLAFICAFSVLVETMQYVFAIGATDITDVITNTLGGFAGLALYGLSKQFTPTKRLDRIISSACMILFVALLAFLLFRFNMNVRRPRSTFQATPSTQKFLAADVHLAWPVTGQAAIGSMEDGLLARSSDDEQPRPTASMAKVIAALAIMEKQPFELGQQGRTYTIDAEDMANLRTYIAEDGSVLPLRMGEKLTQYQAMQRMLVASDNNMADMLTERIFGSRAAYISYAQSMLHRMGLSRTVVADASGFSPDTVSTPSEFVAIGITALKNPVIAGIVAQPEAQLPGVGTIQNTNELLGTSGVIGIKTGTTDEAGSCLLFAAHNTAKGGQEKTIVGVIMGDTDHDSLYNDSRKLLASVWQTF